VGKMGTISQSDLKKVFAAVDARLQKKIDVYVIGGASAILGYNVIKETNDVDLDGGIDADFNQLFQEEADKRGLDQFDLAISKIDRGIEKDDEMEKSKKKIKF